MQDRAKPGSWGKRSVAPTRRRCNSPKPGAERSAAPGGWTPERRLKVCNYPHDTWQTYSLPERVSLRT